MELITSCPLCKERMNSAEDIQTDITGMTRRLSTGIGRSTNHLLGHLLSVYHFLITLSRVVDNEWHLGHCHCVVIGSGNSIACRSKSQITSFHVLKLPGETLHNVEMTDHQRNYRRNRRSRLFPEPEHCHRCTQDESFCCRSSVGFRYGSVIRKFR